MGEDPNLGSRSHHFWFNRNMGICFGESILLFRIKASIVQAFSNRKIIYIIFFLKNNRGATSYLISGFLDSCVLANGEIAS